MGHVPPHRWADALAGRLSSAQRDKQEAHAASCSACAAARARVLEARAACADITAADAPDLHWDHIGARIYWVTSSERRAAGRDDGRSRRRSRLVLAGGLAVACAALALVVLHPGGDDDKADVVGAAPAPLPSPPTPAVEVAPIPATPLSGVVVFARGDVSVDGAPLQFDEVVSPGARLSTGNGSVAVQFAADSSFKLAPESSLHLRAFDDRRVELVVEGTVVVDLARRSEEQHFAVVAGGRAVTVRGTAFRVEHRDGGLDVACLHGRVEVSDGDASVAVEAGQRVHYAAADMVGARRARDLRSEEVVTLEHSVVVPMLPAWPEAAALFATSGVLRLAGRDGQPVKVDGVDRGKSAFMLRVMSGRHHVEIDGRARWVELAAGDRVEALPGDRVADRKLRRSQLAQVLGKDNRVRRCLRPLVKQGLAVGSYLSLGVGVGQSGRISHLNILETNLPSDISRCVRDQVDLITLPPGPEITLRYRLSF